MLPAYAVAPRGLSLRVQPRMMSPTVPGTSASGLPAAASAEVAAQAIEENASAMVAMREEVCRRRKWLRLAWARNQSWIVVAAAAAISTPRAAMNAGHVETRASASTNGANASMMA